MNSEVGTGSADFTYIYKKMKFVLKSAYEVPTSNGLGSACFQVEVGTWDADFETVKVGICSADFDFSLYDSFWKSASGVPTFAQWKSVIQMPTSFQLCTVPLRDFVIN